MVIINLLPWREQCQLYQRKMIKLVLMIPAGLSVLVCLVLHGWLTKIDQQLQVDVADLTQKMTHRESRHPVPIKNSTNQSAKKILLELGARSINVCFTSIKSEQNIMTLQGRAHSVTDLANFLKQEDIAQLFSNIQIEQLEKKSGDIQFTFQGEG